jgi:probable HAF family extracellular repeat protein
MRGRLSALVVLLAMSIRIAPVLNGAASDVWYEVTDLGSLGGHTVGFALNDRGDVSGYAEFADGRFRGFLYTGGEFINLGTLGGDSSIALAINNSGDVVGQAETTLGELHAFLKPRGGEMIDLGTLGGDQSVALGINDAGVIVGAANATVGGRIRAFVYENNVMRDLGVSPTDAYSAALAISNNGIIGGEYTIEASASAARKGFVLDQRGAFYDVGSFGGTTTVVLGVTVKGDAVGFSTTPDNSAARAFLYEDGALRQIGPSLVVASDAAGINSKGTVVGTFSEGLDGGLVSAFLHEDDRSVPISSRLLEGEWRVLGANAINNKGQIVGWANHASTYREHAVLLTPVRLPRR